MNTSTKEILSQGVNFKIRTDAKNKTDHWSTDALSVFRLFGNFQKLSTDDWVNLKNKELMKSYAGEGKNGFTECTADYFLSMAAGKVDMKDFHAARKKLANFSKNLKISLAPIAPQRKRVFSENDGEWNYERRWELKPFTNTKKENTGIRNTLTVNADFSFSARHKTSDINKFGAFCWAIVQELENAGVTCEINVVNCGEDLGLGNELQKFNACTVQVKKAGQYIDEVSLARCFSGYFFRRGCFITWLYGAELQDAKMQSGMGTPRPLGTSSKDGVLNLSFDNQTDNQDDLIKSILKALKGC